VNVADVILEGAGAEGLDLHGGEAQVDAVTDLPQHHRHNRGVLEIEVGAVQLRGAVARVSVAGEGGGKGGDEDDAWRWRITAVSVMQQDLGELGKESWGALGMPVW
jgi:hypothetical protein